MSLFGDEITDFGATAAVWCAASCRPEVWSYYLGQKAGLALVGFVDSLSLAYEYPLLSVVVRNRP